MACMLMHDTCMMNKIMTQIMHVVMTSVARCMSDAQMLIMWLAMLMLVMLTVVILCISLF